jgi:predicted DNA-binding transcriptional regulator YafY
VDRIASSISAIGRPAAFEIDTAALEAEDAKFVLLEKRAILSIRKGRAHQLRGGALISERSEDWDRVEVIYRDEALFIQRVLWYGSDVIIEEPLSLRAALISHLEEAVKLHG